MIDDDQVANFAEIMLAFRRGRAVELPRSLFGEPSWDFLLELFVADARGVRMTGRQISERHQISPAVASRCSCIWLPKALSLAMEVGISTTS